MDPPANTWSNIPPGTPMSIPSEIEHEGANITASPEPPSHPELPPRSVLDRTWEVTTGVDGSAVESNPPACSDLMADRFHAEDQPSSTTLDRSHGFHDRKASDFSGYDGTHLSAESSSIGVNNFGSEHPTKRKLDMILDEEAELVSHATRNKSQRVEPQGSTQVSRVVQFRLVQK